MDTISGGDSTMAPWFDGLIQHSRTIPVTTREHGLAAALLVIVLLVFFWRALPSDQVLSPAAAVFDTPVFASSTPLDGRPEGNELLFDQVYQFTPWRAFARDELRAGRLPLWNSHSSTGTPLVATMQSAVFYPINLALVPVELGRSLLLSALLRLWLAGFGMYLLTRHFGLTLVPALTSSVALMLSQYVVVWLGHPHTNVAVWLPWLVLASELLLTSRGRRSALRAAALMALCTGATLTGGHAETELYVLLTVLVYVLLRCLSLRADLGVARLVRLGTSWVLATLLGAGIAAVQLLPFLEWLPLSAEYGERSERSFSLLQLEFIKELPSLLGGVYPNVYGNPTWEGGYWSFNPWSSYNEGALYIGIIPLALALTAIATAHSHTQVRIWAVIGGLALAMALRLPVVDWFDSLPLLGLAHAGRLRLIVAFSLAVLAGFGAQQLLDRANASNARRWLAATAAGVAILGLLLFIGGGLLLARYESTISDSLEHRIARMSERGDVLPRSLAICRERVPECLDEISSVYRGDHPILYLPAVVALLALPALRFMSPNRLVTALLALTAIDLVAAGSGYNPTLPQDSFYPEPSIIAEAVERQADGRVVFLQQTALPDVQLMFGLSDIRGLDYPLGRYADYLDTTGDRIPWINNGILIRTVESPLTQALGVEYVVTTRAELPWAGPGLVEVARDGEVVLAALPNPIPRGRLLQQVELAADDEAALTALRARPGAVLERVILSDSLATRVVAELVGGTPESDGDVLLVLDEPRHQDWRVTTTQPTLLVVSDAYYPGWQATLDGEAAELLRANVAFRAVAVPAGEHIVEFRYEPRSVRVGLWISLLSLAGALGLLVASVLPWPSRRARPGS